MTWASPPELREDLYARYGLTCPPRWGTPRHPELPTYGPAVGRVMEKLWTAPMPWQQYVLDVSLEVNPNEMVRVLSPTRRPIMVPKFIHREVGMSIMRQQGKTALTLGVSAHRLMAFGKVLVTYAAQNRIHARKKWEDDFAEKLMESALSKRFRLRKTNAMEAIICIESHSLFGITSNTEKASHGDTLDLGLIDEAFSHEDDRMEQAFGPAMLTRPMAQKWWLSAAGTERSVFLNRKREVGRELIQRYWATGERASVAYFEWYPDDEEPRDDPRTWLGCMPALCPDQVCRCDPEGKWRHTTKIADIRTELLTMDPAEFDRAYLNRTRKKTPPPDVNIPVASWPKCYDKGSRRGEEVAFGIDVTPQRDHASVVVFSMRDDVIGHVEIVAFRPGTDWVPGVMRRLKEKYSPIAFGLDAVTGSPANALLEPILKLRDDDGELVFSIPDRGSKPKRGQLWLPTLNEVVSYSGQFMKAMREGKLAHIDQVPLNLAVGGARTRPLGDAWALARRTAQANISPLVGAVLARGAYLARIEVVQDEMIQPSVFFI